MNKEIIENIKTALDKHKKAKINFILNSGHSYLCGTFHIAYEKEDVIVIATTVDNKGKEDKVVVFHVSSIHHVFFEKLEEKDFVGFVTKTS